MRQNDKIEKKREKQVKKDKKELFSQDYSNANMNIYIYIIQGQLTTTSMKGCFILSKSPSTMTSNTYMPGLILLRGCISFLL